MTAAAKRKRSRKVHGRQVMLALASLAGILAVAGAGDAQAGGKGGWGCGAIYRPLYPGKVVRGEPGCLPPGWRAYPVSIMNDIYVIQPDRRKIRTNFTARKSRRPRR